MLKFDYVIERDEGNEIKKYTPNNIPQELDNLVSIEGPNASGKSTLLNIIGLGLYAGEMENINSSLKLKINNLINAKHQKIRFNFKITNEDNSIVLESIKDDFNSRDIRLYETTNGDKRILGPDLFHKKYNLIYDIPDNPIDRLNQLIKDIKYDQEYTGSKILSLHSYINMILEQIANSKDPKRIGILKNEVKRYNDNKGNIIDKINILNEQVFFLEKYYNGKKFLMTKNRIIELEKYLMDLKKEVKSKEKKAKKLSKENKRIIDEIDDKFLNFKNNFDKVNSLLDPLITNKDIREIYENIWYHYDINKIKRERKFDKHFSDCIAHFINYMATKFNENDNKKVKSLEKIQMIIDFLNKFKDDNIEIPGLDITFNEIIDRLNERNTENRDLLILKKNVEEVLKLLTEIQQQKNYFVNNLFPKMIKIDSEYRNGIFDKLNSNSEEDILRTKTELRILKADYTKYLGECSRLKMEIDEISYELSRINVSDLFQPFKIQTLEQLEFTIKDKKAALRMEKNNLEKIKRSISLHKEEIERLEKMEEHPYANRIEEIKEIRKNITLLVEKVSKDYKKYIDKLINNNQISEKDINNNIEMKNYFNLIFKYLGKRIGEIKHVNDTYKVNKVNLISNIIETVEGKKIYLSDLGTGHSQSAYLLGVLNPSDDRRLIALFDEIAMMDTNSLKPIFDKMRDLYSRDKLLLGIVVKKGDEMQVRPIK